LDQVGLVEPWFNLRDLNGSTYPEGEFQFGS